MIRILLALQIIIKQPIGTTRYPGVAKGLYVASASGSSNVFLNNFSLICFPSEVFLVTLQNSKVYRNCIDVFQVSVISPCFCVCDSTLCSENDPLIFQMYFCSCLGKPALSKVEVLERDSQLNQTLVQVFCMLHTVHFELILMHICSTFLCPNIRRNLGKTLWNKLHMEHHLTFLNFKYLLICFNRSRLNQDGHTKFAFIFLSQGILCWVNLSIDIFLLSQKEVYILVKIQEAINMGMKAHYLFRVFIMVQWLLIRYVQKLKELMLKLSNCTSLTNAFVNYQVILFMMLEGNQCALILNMRMRVLLKTGTNVFLFMQLQMVWSFISLSFSLHLDASRSSDIFERGKGSC